MRIKSSLIGMLLIAGCVHSSSTPDGSGGSGGSGGGTGGSGGIGGNGGDDLAMLPALDMAGGVDAAPVDRLRFAVFGDVRPDPGGTFPTATVKSIFDGAQAKNVQFIVGTGDYMLAIGAAGDQATIDAQLKLYDQARQGFTSPIYLAMGNHECMLSSTANCPNFNETPNVKTFMARLVPAGTTLPYYRINVATSQGSAKLLFVAASAWTAAQSTWLTQQIADPTKYTFIIRHQPSDVSMPGVTESDTIIKGKPVTATLFGHTHTYQKIDDRHVICGNGGASGPTFFGYLLVEQQADGTLTLTEYDSSTGMSRDTWSLTP
jgi:hypothetical protein